MLHFRATLVTAVLLLITSEAFADLIGPVISVLDGDTIEAQRNGKDERIRLQGIGYSEKGQPFSNNAKQATSNLVFAQIVTGETDLITTVEF